MNAHEVVRDLGHPNPKVATEAKNTIIDYLGQQDLDVKDPTKRSLIRNLERMLSLPSAAEILSFYQEQRDQKLTYETELWNYIKDSRIKEKEFHEAKRFYQKVDPFFGEMNRLVDLCAGNGLAGIIWALEGKAEEVILVDKEENSNYKPLIKFAQDLKPIKLDYVVADLKYFKPPLANALISVHPCGELADHVIEKAITSGFPVALVPCCHSKTHHLSAEQLAYFDSKTDAIDLARVQYLKYNHFKVNLRKIDPKITDKNRIIIGIPNTELKTK